ncbi:hypothetical protein F4811DRAFT_69036 [Daldinia bambusicola]|nr:hypothetical protein F4811DRAFT_69036 [Daldinia bambusicola]
MSQLFCDISTQTLGMIFTLDVSITTTVEQTLKTQIQDHTASIICRNLRLFLVAKDYFRRYMVSFLCLMSPSTEFAIMDYIPLGFIPTWVLYSATLVITHILHINLNASQFYLQSHQTRVFFLATPGYLNGIFQIAVMFEFPKLTPIA